MRCNSTPRRLGEHGACPTENKILLRALFVSVVSHCRPRTSRLQSRRMNCRHLVLVFEPNALASGLFWHEGHGKPAASAVGSIHASALQIGLRPRLARSPQGRPHRLLRPHFISVSVRSQTPPCGTRPASEDGAGLAELREVGKTACRVAIPARKKKAHGKAVGL